MSEEKEINTNVHIKNVINFIKNNWIILVLVSLTITGFFIYQKKVEYYDNTIQILQSEHEKEINEIKNAREEERKRYEENEKKYQEKLELIEKEYEDAKTKLDEKKQEREKEIIKKYGSKPDKLAEKLSEITGFKIIMPED